MHRTLLIILFTLIFMLGVQKPHQSISALDAAVSFEGSSVLSNGATSQGSKVLALEWLSKSSMPRFVNRPMEARK